MKTFTTLFCIELKLSLRSMDALFFVLIMPVIICGTVALVFSGGDFSETPVVIQNGFGAYIAIGICAIGLMGLPLVLSDYRHKKILKRLQITPVSPALLLGIQFAVETVMAVFSAVIVTLFAIVFLKYSKQGNIILILAAYFTVLVSIFSIGLLVASTATDIKKAGMISSIIYFPMLLFSGTTVPTTVFPEKIQTLIKFLPLSRGIEVINGMLLGHSPVLYVKHITILLMLSAICIAISVKFFRWEM